MRELTIEKLWLMAGLCLNSSLHLLCITKHMYITWWVPHKYLLNWIKPKFPLMQAYQVLSKHVFKDFNVLPLSFTYRISMQMYWWLLKHFSINPLVSHLFKFLHLLNRYWSIFTFDCVDGYHYHLYQLSGHRVGEGLEDL